jgi:hypothetical protein
VGEACSRPLLGIPGSLAFAFGKRLRYGPLPDAVRPLPRTDLARSPGLADRDWRPVPRGRRGMQSCGFLRRRRRVRGDDRVASRALRRTGDNRLFRPPRDRGDGVHRSRRNTRPCRRRDGRDVELYGLGQRFNGRRRSRGATADVSSGGIHFGGSRRDYVRRPDRGHGGRGRGPLFVGHGCVGRRRSRLRRPRPGGLHRRGRHDQRVRHGQCALSFVLALTRRIGGGWIPAFRLCSAVVQERRTLGFRTRVLASVDAHARVVIRPAAIVGYPSLRGEPIARVCRPDRPALSRTRPSKAHARARRDRRGRLARRRAARARRLRAGQERE